MRTAIVTGDYFRLNQTFVNRHIAHIFGGAVCVICNGETGKNPYGVPVLARRSVERSIFDRLAVPILRVKNKMSNGTSRTPTGAHRRALMSFLTEHRVEVVLGEFGTETLGIADLVQEMGIPCYSYFRGMDASMALTRKSRRHGYKLMFPKLKGIVAVSQFLLDNLAARDLTHPNAHVIPSGVDIRRFRPGRKIPRSFLAVGRMVEKKAPSIALRAFATATADAPDARLRFIGDGPLLEPARALAGKLGIAERVVFDGAREHAHVRAALAESGVFLQHSVTGRDGNTEGLPTAIQEALASGCMVISTRHAGIPEAVEDGVNGWLVPERDEAGFADRIRRTLSQDMSPFTAAARRTAVARFDNAKSLKKLETVLRQSSVDS